jgi:heat shock protein HslJ
MRKASHLFFINILCLFLIQCKSKPIEVVTQNIQNPLKRVWMLTQFKEFDRTELIKYQAQINLTDLDLPSAKMGCNKISFKITEKKDNKMVISDLRQTKKFCIDGMNLEKSFIKEFPAYTAFKVEGSKLTLTNDKGETISCIAQDWD